MISATVMRLTTSHDRSTGRGSLPEWVGFSLATSSPHPRRRHTHISARPSKGD